jgi:hypothetical protein
VSLEAVHIGSQGFIIIEFFLERHQIQALRIEADG